MAVKTFRARSFAQFTLSEQIQILRCAQNDSERAQDDSIAAIFRSLFSPDMISQNRPRSSAPEASGLNALLPGLFVEPKGPTPVPNWRRQLRTLPGQGHFPKGLE
jgi:hypothetical protein